MQGKSTVAALFLASLRSCLKEIGIMKIYGFCSFFAKLWKIFALFAEI